MADETAYAGDMAEVHAEAYSDVARLAAPAVAEILAGEGVPSGLIVELGCGSGVPARPLVDRGYSVHGIDLSADMVRLAGERVPEAEIVRGSFLDAPLPACDAVLAIGQTLGYVVDP